MNMEIQAALDVADETDSFLQITDVIYDKQSEQGYGNMTESEQTVFCIDGFLREMENGGFVQFFHHEAGALSADTLAALERIKSKECHGLLDKVLGFFEARQVPSDEDDRIEAFDSIQDEFSDEISALDEKYFELTENIVALTLSFVSKHLKDFH